MIPAGAAGRRCTPSCGTRPTGHLIYLTPACDEHGSGTGHPDRIAQAADQLIRPAFWARALVIQPITGELGSSTIIPDVHLNLNRLEIQQPGHEPGGRLRPVLRDDHGRRRRRGHRRAGAAVDRGHGARQAQGNAERPQGKLHLTNEGD
jgi:hypothetical protein